MYRAVVPLQFVVAGLRMTGILALLRAVSLWLSKLLGGGVAVEAGDVFTRARAEQLLREGVASGGLSTYQRDLIDRIMRISRIGVQEVMVPIDRMLAVPLDLPREDFLRMAQMAHFSRVPVYDKVRTKVVGIVDVMEVIMDRDEKKLADYIKPVERLGTDANVTSALLRMQRKRQKIAIIERSRGRCVGLLTMKDLAEEIVGDLEAW